MDLRKVAIGQDDLKEELKNDISTVKKDISDVKGEINAGQEQLRKEIKDFQERAGITRPARLNSKKG
jgi:gas vesicle protein